MAFISLLIGSHLSSSPRPLKEARALQMAGHKVTVAGVWFDDTLAEQDRILSRENDIHFIPVLDFRKHKFISNIRTRGKQRIVKALYRLTGIVQSDVFGYGTQQHLRYALSSKADLIIVHSEAGLFVANKLLQRGIRVGVDFEDWFSRDLPIESRRARPVLELENLERSLLGECSYALAPSKCMASALSKAYDVPLPKVIYNTFFASDADSLDGLTCDRCDKDKISLHWFSHSLGAGRGLETLFQALENVRQPLEVHLRGACTESVRAYFHSLREAVPHHSVFFHERVPPGDLLSRIAEHDICLALEPDEIESTDLTVSNKLFQYMLAGKCIIATRTKGQEEVMSEWADPHQLISPGSGTELADSLTYFIERKDERENVGSAAQYAARTEYAYDHQVIKIQKYVDEALSI